MLLLQQGMQRNGRAYPILGGEEENSEGSSFLML